MTWPVKLHADAGLTIPGRVSMAARVHRSGTDQEAARLLLNFKGLYYKTEWVYEYAPSVLQILLM